MATTSIVLAFMSVLGLASASGLIGGYGFGLPASTTYSHGHDHFGHGGFGGLYGYGGGFSSFGSMSHGIGYGGWGYPGIYGGAHVSTSPVKYHGYTVGSPHVQSLGVHYPTHHHDSWNFGGYGGYLPSVGHSFQTFSHGIGGIGGIGGMGHGFDLGHHFNHFGHY